MKISDATLEALRPEPEPLDPAWSHDTLTAILADEPAARPGPRGRTRARVALVTLAVAATSTVGFGVAVAVGELKAQSFTDTFSFWRTTPVPGRQAVDPGQAQRVATAPGPRNTVFSVLTTPSGYACRTAVLESAESAAAPLPTTFIDVTSNWCSDAPSGADFGGVDVSFQADVAGFVVVAANATRAEVRTRDGQEYPALLVDGHFWGWFPAQAHPTLVGYAADGSVIGRVDLGAGAGAEAPAPDQAR